MAQARPAAGWRYEDLLAMPDDGTRFEIIEGDLYETPSPTWAHQTILFNLVMLLAPLVRALGGTLRFAPLDVFFPGADPVQPDLMALLPGGEAHGAGRGIEGVPDFVVEVLSPSTRGRDLLTKRALYARAGVREYWIVDPESRTIDVHMLDRGIFPEPVSVGEDGRVVSPLLGAEFAGADVFAGLDEGSEEA